MVGLSLPGRVLAALVLAGLGVMACAHLAMVFLHVAPTEWIDLSAEGHEAIRGNPAPSHVDHSELRRAWEFLGGSVRRIQIRSVTRSVEPPVWSKEWSEEETDDQSYYRVLPWWTAETGR